MKYKILVVLLPLLAGCNVHSKNDSGSDENVTINADESGHIAFNLPFIEGQVKIPTLVLGNGNFDIDGVRLMPGSKITGFSVDAADRGSTVNLAFAAPASPDQTRTYFLDQFKQKGVRASLNGDAVAGVSKDGSPFTINVAQAGSGSEGRIVIHAQH